ncbi:MAG: PEP-CTERM sorting domain-containing protein [Gemmatimonadota bacterium]|nr:PEP-CTERM sorting domain-containing protein [Gemmatimonadota bacterium]
MRRFSGLSLGLALLAAPIGVEAQGVYTGVPPTMDYFEFVNGGDQPGTFGVMVGPYVGNFLNDGATGNFSIYCVDYLHYASNATGKVNVTQLADAAGALDNTRLGSNLPVGDAYGKYSRAAFYAALFDVTADLDPDDRKVVWSGIHAAIWSVTSGVLKGSGDTADIRDDLLAFTDAQYDEIGAAIGFDASEWYVITRVDFEDGYRESGDYKGQEFLMRRVPEPGTLLLMLTGFGLLLVASRRRNLLESL